MQVTRAMNVASDRGPGDPTQNLPENGNLASEADTSIALVCGAAAVAMGIYFACFAPRTRFSETSTVTPVRDLPTSPFLELGSPVHGRRPWLFSDQSMGSATGSPSVVDGGRSRENESERGRSVSEPSVPTFFAEVRR